MPRNIALHKSPVSSCVIFSITKYRPRICSIKHSYIVTFTQSSKQYIVLKRLFTDPGNYMIVCCSNMPLSHALSLYIFSLSSTYIVLTLRGGQIHSNVKLKLFHILKRLYCSYSFPNLVISNNPRHQIFNLLIFICPRLPFFSSS